MKYKGNNREISHIFCKPRRNMRVTTEISYVLGNWHSFNMLQSGGQYPSVIKPKLLLCTLSNINLNTFTESSHQSEVARHLHRVCPQIQTKIQGTVPVLHMLDIPQAHGCHFKSKTNWWQLPFSLMKKKKYQTTLH